MEWENVIKEICENNTGQTPHENGVIQGIYYSEDDNGNILFDIESIRDEFEFLLRRLEKYNETSNFDWDNI